MIVHLTGSIRSMDEDIMYLRRIIKTIYENDGVLARDWVETAYHRGKVGKIKDEDVDWQEVFDGNMDAISRADMVIVEDTSHSFSKGYQTAISLQQKRPTLILSRKSLKGRFISGCKNKLLTLKEYKTEAELDRVVARFIKDNAIRSKDLRFNFFIDRPIYNYLRSVSYETGKNKSEVIRELIEREIKKTQD